jgi:penicillin-binding protein 1A
MAKRKSRPKPTLGTRLLKLGLWLGLAGAVVGAGALGVGYLWFSHDLPTFERLEDYDPPQVTRLLDDSGTPFAEFYIERRTLVPREHIPDVIVNAVLSAEDKAFFTHEGLDYTGMLRALWNSAKAGHVRGSGSTITQQTVKNLVLSPERSFQRKARELILARRLEQSLSKDEILTLYLNAVYFGHGRYGVQEAARFYFAKDIKDLTLPEAATLAGVIQSPERLSPRKHPDRARERRNWVLGEMGENGFASAADVATAKASSIEPPPAPADSLAEGAWFAEEVKRSLVQALGEDAVFKGGLVVHTTLNLPAQRAAIDALRAGLTALDGRQGFGRKPRHVDDAAAWRKKRAAKLGDKPPPPGQIVAARIDAIDDDRLVFDLGVGTAEVPLEQATRYRVAPKPPAGPPSPAGPPPPASLPWRVGDVLEVAVRADGPKPPERQHAALAFSPQGAFVVIEPQTRAVRVLVGSERFDAYPFNRVTQAKRQPGSTFKPFVYGAAIASRRYSGSTIVLDSPETFLLGRDKQWRPENYTGKYEGPLPLRRALAKSLNTVAIKLINDLGVPAVRAFAQQAGIEDPYVDNLTLALGSSEVTPLELANAYATFAADGRFARPQWITRVEGITPEQASAVAPLTTPPVFEQRIEPAVAWLVRDLLRGVVTDGTGSALKDVPRPLVGKTGTTNDARDAWFAGLLPEAAMVAWIGFDDNRPLGRKETGGQATVPVIEQWVRAAALKGPDWPAPPPGVVTRRIDPASGLLMPDDIPEGGEVAPFLDGTAPVQVTTAPGELGAADLRAAAPSVGGDEALLDDMAPLAPAAAPTFAPGEGPPDSGAAEQALRRLPQVDAGDPPTAPPPRAPDDEDRPPE